MEGAGSGPLRSHLKMKIIIYPCRPLQRGQTKHERQNQDIITLTLAVQSELSNAEYAEVAETRTQRQGNSGV